MDALGLFDKVCNIVYNEYYFKNNEQMIEFNKNVNNYRKNINKNHDKSYTYRLLEEVVNSLSDPHAIIISPMHGMILNADIFIIGRTFYLIGYDKEGVTHKIIKKINGYTTDEIFKLYGDKQDNLPSVTIRGKILEDFKNCKNIFNKNICIVEYEFENMIEKQSLYPIDMQEYINQVLKANKKEEVSNSVKPIIINKYEDNILIIKIVSFRNTNIAEIFKEEVLKINDYQNIDYIIFDIRNNVGGYVDETKKIVSMIVGTDIKLDYIVRDKYGRNYNEVQKIRSNQLDIFKSKSLFAFINDATMSSAEFVFLKGLQLSNEKFKTIGSRTAGVSGQAKIIDVDDNVKIQLTTKRYYMLSGEELDKGIDADYYVKEEIEDYFGKPDNYIECFRNIFSNT